MELRHLRYFVAVAEHQNITRAAEQLHVSQPPLSRQIRDLEQELGVDLLERGPKQVKLTPAGRTFLKDARRLLGDAEAAIHRVRAQHGSLGGELSIGYAPTLVADLLPVALEAFRKAEPRANIVLYDLTTGEMMAGVEKGKLDLALLVRAPEKTAGSLKFTRLFTLPVGVLMPPKHRFAARASLKLEEVVEETLVTYIRKGYSDYHHWLRSALKSVSGKPRLLPVADGATSIIAAVLAGQGIAFGTPTFTAYSAGRVKFVPLSTRLSPIEVGYLQQKRKGDRLLQVFTQCLEKAAGKAGR